jgi:6-phosphogluconolactonase
MEAVYVQTNDAEKNEIVAYRRESDGSLKKIGSFETGGHGTGKPHLPSQSSIVLSDDGAWLLVANCGNDTISLFAVEANGLLLSDVVPSGGGTPTSIAVRGPLVYVANNADAKVAGFRISGGKLEGLVGSTRPLSGEGADPAQIGFSPDGKTLVVTERGSNSISAYAIDAQGYADGPSTIQSPGETPYGFGFTRDGRLVVTEAFGGAKGKAAASSYEITEPGRLRPLSASVADTRSEVCWAVVSKDGRFVYVTNFGDGTISSYSLADDGTLELAEAVAASTRMDVPGVRDEAITNDGRFIYALDADTQMVHGWSIDGDGHLSEIGAADGLPSTVAGLAAS